MLKTLTSLSLVAALACTSARAADNSPILGKTIELRAELMVTDTQGTATSTRTEPLIRRIRIVRDGAIAVGSGLPADGEARARLNQTMYLPSPPDLVFPESRHGAAYSSATARVGFGHGLLTITTNSQALIRSSLSHCVAHGFTTIAVSEGLCRVNDSNFTSFCGPPENSMSRRELVRAVSCTIN